MGHDDDKPARNVLGDLIIPAAAFAFAIYYLTTITEVPWISQASAVFVSALLLVTIIIYAVRTVLRVRRGVERIGFDGLLFEIPTQVRRAVLLGLTIAYVAVLDTLGFTLATFVFLFAAIIVLSSVYNWKKAFGVALGSAVSGYVVFILLFNTRFPEGWIERTVEEWLRNGG